MNREMKLKLLTIIPFVSELIASFFLPAEIPVHYNMSFQADGYGSKYCLFIIGVFVIVFGLFMNWIYIKNKNTEHETAIYRLCVVGLLIFNVINLFLLYGSLFVEI